MASGSALLAHSGTSGMLQMMHSSESSTNGDAMVTLISPGSSGQGHHFGSPGGNVSAGLEEAVQPAGLAHQNGSPSSGNLKRTFYPTLFESSEETGDDDGGDDMSQPAEKKRRLTAEQVRSLEKNFEMENKLEPERKMQLARDLGLQPRQVAVWFQNRRARWKTKQLEKDYEVLKADYDTLKGDYTALVEEKDKLVAEVKRLNSSAKSSPGLTPADAPPPDHSKASSSETLKKSVKQAAERQSEPHAISLKAVAPTDAVSVATSKVIPALPQSAKPALITSDSLAIPVKDMNARDFQLSPTSVSNFPGGNNIMSLDSRCKSGSYIGGGSPHSGSSSDTNSVNSDGSNVDSPHPPIDSSFSPGGSGQFLSMLREQNSTANNEYLGGGRGGVSMSTWSSTTTVGCGGNSSSCYGVVSPMVASPCSSLSILNVDLSFPNPGTPAQACMLSGMDSPFEGLSDFSNQKMLHTCAGFGAQRPIVKLEEGCSLPLHSEDLPSYIFNMDDQGALPWWDWP